MRRLSVKIIFISFISMMISGMIARIVYYFVVGDNFHNAITEEKIFWLGIITLLIALIIFAYATNRFIGRRIKLIEKATLKVMDGDYDFVLDTKGNDEITSLSCNFNLMKDALKSNEYLNKEFVRNFSHEFKTPLSVIRGYAELLESDDLKPEERSNYLEIILSESERLSSLANNMLQISLIDSKSIIVKNDEYNLTEQIRNVIQMVQVMWEEKNLRFDLDLKEVYIKNNKELTYQIILNLLSNAIKFSDKNGEVKISLTESETKLNLSIANKGQEIPLDDQEKVFQLFYVADKTRNESSTGIGLTLTKKIIDKLKGEITFESNKGITTFYVELCK